MTICDNDNDEFDVFVVCKELIGSCAEFREIIEIVGIVVEEEILLEQDEFLLLVLVVLLLLLAPILFNVRLVVKLDDK